MNNYSRNLFIEMEYGTVKSFRRALVFAMFVTFLTSCSNSEDVNVGLLREQAQKASIACDEYFSSVTNFALSGGDIASKNAFSANIRKLVDELSLMNAINFTEVMKKVANEESQESENDDFKNWQEIANFDKLSEAEMKRFLSVTVKSECSKWSTFAEYSDSQITAYYSMAPTDVNALPEQVCDVLRIEATKQEIYGSMDVEQCDTQSGDGELHLIVGLNDWLEWIDINNPPSGDEIGNVIFDAPLGLVVESFRNSDVSPSEFGSILIFIRDSESTVYEIAPEDLKMTLDSENKQQALLELREKIFMTQNK